MRVFISWSGSQSKAIATVFSNWLSQVIQAVEPWLSTEIQKGSRWGTEVNESLQVLPVAIICLTRENLQAPWILFEAGAISSHKEAFVCTLLHGIEPTDVKPPLSQFQHTSFEKDDIKKLLESINRRIADAGGKSLTDQNLSDIFEFNWPRLEQDVASIPTSETLNLDAHRSEREMLKEALELLRGQERRSSESDRKRLVEDIAEALYKRTSMLRDASRLASLAGQGVLATTARSSAASEPKGTALIPEPDF